VNTQRIDGNNFVSRICESQETKPQKGGDLEDRTKAGETWNLERISYAQHRDKEEDNFSDKIVNIL
jgi:hypothetical protein